MYTKEDLEKATAKEKDLMIKSNEYEQALIDAKAQHTKEITTLKAENKSLGEINTKYANKIIEQFGEDVDDKPAGGHKGDIAEAIIKKANEIASKKG